MVHRMAISGGTDWKPHFAGSEGAYLLLWGQSLAALAFYTNDTIDWAHLWSLKPWVTRATAYQRR